MEQGNKKYSKERNDPGSAPCDGFAPNSPAISPPSYLGAAVGSRPPPAATFSSNEKNNSTTKQPSNKLGVDQADIRIHNSPDRGKNPNNYKSSAAVPRATHYCTWLIHVTISPDAEKKVAEAKSSLQISYNNDEFECRRIRDGYYLASIPIPKKPIREFAQYKVIFKLPKKILLYDYLDTINICEGSFQIPTKQANNNSIVIFAFNDSVALHIQALNHLTFLFSLQFDQAFTRIASDLLEAFKYSPEIYNRNLYLKAAIRSAIIPFDFYFYNFCCICLTRSNDLILLHVKYSILQRSCGKIRIFSVSTGLSLPAWLS